MDSNPEPPAATAGEFGEPWDAELPHGHIRDKPGDLVAKCPSSRLRYRIAACVNACAGLADPERDVAELRQQATYWRAQAEAAGQLCERSQRDVAELVAALENIRDYPSPTAALLQFIARDALARHAPGREAKA